MYYNIKNPKQYIPGNLTQANKESTYHSILFHDIINTKQLIWIIIL